jgi:hypothetical protein
LHPVLSPEKIWHHQSPRHDNLTTRFNAASVVPN